MTHIDQQTRRRIMRTGVTALDRQRACPGHVLYTPMSGDGAVYLIDLEGGMVHRWDLPHHPGPYGYLLPNGNLFYLARVRDESWDRFPAWNRFKGGLIQEIDWDGNVVWEHRDPDHHHDARRTASGGTIYLALERVPASVAAKVRGGVPGSDGDGMWADRIVEVDAAGRKVWEWSAYRHLDVETDVLPHNVDRTEWTHANTVVPLDGDRVMVSFRHISTVAIIDKATGGIVWRLGPQVLSHQHDPSMLPNGNVLVFDNGPLRRRGHRPYSRVIEIEPATKRVVWEYVDSPTYNFFSHAISGARRLVNGNTLITEGNFGRMFQVTSAGEVVWEYINPHFPSGLDGVPENMVFRAAHYPPGSIPALSRG